jgi:putative toxin-antitoxin system antitoxin component (TIGR02293 family)
MGKLKKVDFTTMDQLIRKGIPLRSCNRLNKALNLSDEELAHALGVSARTLSIKGGSTNRLPFVASDRIYRLTRMLVLAIDLIEDEEAAAEWLRQPQIGLGGRSPFDVMLTELGYREVEDLLGRIGHGAIS